MSISPKKHKYPKPFAGRSAKVELCLFLFSPSTFMKFSGVTMRKVFTELGKESLFKSIESAVKHESSPSEKIQADLVNTINSLSVKDQPNLKVKELIGAMLEPASATTEIREMGFWESYLLGRDKLQIHQQFILEIEQKCKPVSFEISRGGFQKAWFYLNNDPLLKNFLWPSVKSAYKRVSTIQELAPIQLAIALEVQLSVLASIDVSLMSDKTDLETSLFIQLLPTEEYSPTAKFFHWLKQLLEARTIDEWVNHEQILPFFDDDELDVSTVKRWSSGTFHPSHKLINRLASAIYPSGGSEPLIARDWASRYINALGYLAQQCSERAESAIAGSKNESRKWQPWPIFPFGFSTFHEWIINRYPIWLEFHIKR